MPIDVSTLVTIMGIIFLLVFLVIFLVILISFLRWFRRPRIYYAPIRVEDYMCPKCGSRDLDLIGLRTMRCRKCGTTFTLRAAYEERWIVWPLLWWFPIIIPIPELLRK
ncbi:MAG: hypothetical protein QXS10_03795 [Candidatus Bathyarchaeia archaeon]